VKMEDYYRIKDSEENNGIWELLVKL